MKKHEIEIIDQGLTTRCNLRCPFCNRQLFDYHPRKNDISIDILRKVYTPDFRKQLIKVILCGSWGDPSLYKHFDALMELLEYDKFTLNTNGTTKNTKWWYEFGKKCKSADVVFAIDGVETYSKYRVGGSFEKVFNNMKNFIEGGGKAYWQYILFKYNEGEDYEKAKKLAEQVGAIILTKFSHTYTNDFQKPTQFFQIKEQRPWCMIPDRHQISIDSFGDVTPCCHTRPSKLIRQKNGFDEKMVARYIKDRKNINLYHVSLEEALESDFIKFFVRNYKDLTICQRSCGWRKWIE